jgi:type IV secretion system protein VirB10
MRETLRRHELLDSSAIRDPRSGEGAEIISLATRSVMPIVTQRKGRSDALGLAAGVAVVGLLGAVTLWNLDYSRKTASMAQPAITQPAPAAPQVAPPASQPVITAPAEPAKSPVPVPAAAPVPGTLPVSNPYSTPTVIYDVTPLAASAPVAAAGAAAGGTTATGPNDDFAARVGGIGGTATVAVAAINPQTTVTQGTLIPAILETAIDTDVPGYARAVVSTDVRGFDGSRVMVPRSSRLIGQYKSGMQAGQKRAYIIWTRLIRPDGVSVNLASPAISFAGETGLGGDVDNHFFERFGSAMLLSVVGSLSALGSSGASVIIGGQTQSAAAAAVGQTGQIGPTIRVSQGEPIRVFTARDLDFSKVTTE